VDEPVGLVIAIPVIVLSLWGVSLIGGLANGQSRATVASELAAQAASQAATSEAADTADRVALGATLDSCTKTTANTAVSNAVPGSVSVSARSATVTLICEVAGPFGGSRVCVIGYAQTRPAVSAHHLVSCPATN